MFASLRVWYVEVKLWWELLVGWVKEGGGGKMVVVFAPFPPPARPCSSLWIAGDD